MPWINAGARALVLTMLLAIAAAPAVVCRAEMIDAERAAVPQTQADADRAKVQAFLARAEVRDKLQAMGVAAAMVPGRLDAMTPEEVHALAQRIDSLPAGGALSQSDWILILLVAVLLVLVL